MGQTSSSDEDYARKLQEEENARARGLSDGYYGSASHGQAQNAGQGYPPAYGQEGQQYGQQSYGQQQQYGQSSSGNDNMPPRPAEKKGLMGKLLGKVSGGSAGGAAGGYGGQQYGQQQYRPQQQYGQPMYGQPMQASRPGMSGTQGAMLGAGGGLLGGMLIGDMMGDAVSVGDQDSVKETDAYYRAMVAVTAVMAVVTAVMAVVMAETTMTEAMAAAIWVVVVTFRRRHAHIHEQIASNTTQMFQRRASIQLSTCLVIDCHFCRCHVVTLLEQSTTGHQPWQCSSGGPGHDGCIPTRCHTMQLQRSVQSTKSIQSRATYQA